ncbi:response regulator transcription factor [Novosphingobium aquiterrae]|uniref:Response regulator transcription factor n=1 Tax=Novosphingobium aquiterrae TaxID=624388 RepID=A0ABV6PJY2_9SPHN
MELVHLPYLSQTQSMQTATLHPADRSSDAPRRRTLLALVDSDDEQALDRLMSVLPNARFVDLSSPHATPVPTTSHAEKAAPDPQLLTSRQSEIFALMLEGLSNKAIGRRIGISHFTVRNHVSKLMQILNIPTRRDIRRALHDAIPISDHQDQPDRDRTENSPRARM